MSCENNTNHLSKTASQAAGLPAIASKSGFVFGRMIYNLDPTRNFGAITATARKMSKVTRDINPMTSVGKSLYRTGENSAKPVAYTDRIMRELGIGETLSGGAATTVKTAENLAGTGMAFVGYAMGIAGPEGDPQKRSLAQELAKLRDVASSRPGQFIITKLIPQLGLPLLVGQLARGAFSVGVSQLVRLSRTRNLGTTTQEKNLLFFFKRNIPVKMWGSSLTPTLNRLDVVGNPQKIISNSGVMFRLGKVGSTWHNGTTVVKMGNGQSRTITHLQDLTFPANHYYFNRQISNKEAVGIASGQVKPKSVSGYVGYVSPVEGLMPAWANAKQCLIKAYLSYGLLSSKKSEYEG
ncbi:MAG: hypothetical protein KJ077_47910 [Anaerolineae bacterium]|nr:hypothetical protein [Anaerolineae bacterium]